MTRPATVVLMGGALGDTALTVPLLAGLPARWPGGVLVLARPDYLCVLRASRSAVSAEAFDRPPWNALFREPGDDPPAALASVLADASAVVNLLDSSGGPVQRNLERLVGERLISLPARPPPAWADLVSAYYLEGVGLPGLQAEQDWLDLPLSQRLPARADLQRHLTHAGRPIVLLHPGSGGLAKCWPVECFTALADRAAAAGLDPLFLVGPDELERFGQKLLFALQHHAPVIGPLPLPEALASAAAADAYVGNDAGLTHVAAMLGTPTVALFGPTDPALWRPLGSAVTVLRREPLTDLAVDDVLAAVLDLLGQGSREG